MAEFKVGGEVDSYCTRCKMVLAHTVLAVWAGSIKKVQCNTCGGQHAFRKAEPGAASASSSAAPRPSRPRAAAADKPKAASAASALSSSYDELIANKDRGSARAFNIKEKFAVGDLLQHPTFGLGVVAAVRGLDKNRRGVSEHGEDPDAQQGRCAGNLRQACRAPRQPRGDRGRRGDTGPRSGDLGRGPAVVAG
ncbi:MAG: hypothetical protein QM765_44375 [Myxococcales bacterium]